MGWTMSETPDAQKGGMVREGSFSAKPAEAFPLKKIFPAGRARRGAGARGKRRRSAENDAARHVGMSGARGRSLCGAA